MPTDRLKSVAFIALLGALACNAFSNSLFEIFSGVFLLLGLFLLTFERRWDLFCSRIAVFAGLYLFMVLLSVFGSEYLSNSLRGLFRVFRCLAMVFVTMYLVDDTRKFGMAFRTLTFVAFLMGVDACAQGVLGFDLLLRRGLTPYIEGWGRVTGPFHHANDFATYLSIVIFLFLGMLPTVFMKSKIATKIFYVSGSALLTACLLWTYARGAWLAVTTGLLFMALITRNRKMLVMLVLGVALIFILSPPAVRGRLGSLLNWKDGTMTERRILWNESLQMIRQRPWTGFGINTYSKVEPLFKSKEVYTDNQYAHNGYLQIAAETGLLGVGSFLAFLIFFFSKISKRLLRRDGCFEAAALAALVCGLLSFLIHCSTDTGLQSLRLVSLLWLCIGLALSAEKLLEIKHP